MADDGDFKDAVARLGELLAARRQLSPARAIREARIKTAMTKITRVIYREIVCHQKELERRVCEVGFRFYPLAEQKDRPEPVHLNEARQRLAAQDRLAWNRVRISGNDHYFYYDPERDPALVAEVLKQRVEAVKAFEAVQRDPHLSGWVLERLLHTGMERSGQVDAEPYRAGVDIQDFNGAHATHGIDLAGTHTVAGLPFVVEVKNIREWVYPHSAIVWRLLGTAAELGAVPILMCRRVPEPTYLFMDEIGGYAYPTMNLMIDKALDGDPRAGPFHDAVRVLGYKDVRLIDPDDPPERFAHVFRDRLGGRLAEMSATFGPLRESVLGIARDEDLWTDQAKRGRVTGRTRKEIVREFWGAVRSNEVSVGLPDVVEDF